MTRSAIVPTLLVVGLGLMGSSAALAAKKFSLAGRVVGYARREETAKKALELGVVDEAYADLPLALSKLSAGDLVVIGVPVLSMRSILAVVKAHCPNDVSITDVGSTKVSVLTDVECVWGEAPAQFVGSHPIAGSEKHGVEAGIASLFVNHAVIITPSSASGAEHIQRVTAFWTGCGARVDTLSPQRHDEILAATSHLPHLLSFSLVDALASQDDHEEIFRYAAGGFRDFTRIAESDPVMWRDIMLANSNAVMETLAGFEHNLARLRSALESKDSEALESCFSRAKRARRDHVSKRS